MARTSKQSRQNGRNRKSKAKSPRKTAQKRPSPLLFLAKWIAVAAIWGGLAAGVVAVFFAYDLPDVDDALSATRRPTVSIVAADGTELITVGDLYGMPARIEDMPRALPAAVLATEDRRFYSHGAVDMQGLARAMAENIKAGRIVQGGSTITQQVAKNLFLTSDRTIKRKAQELLLALWLERNFTKNQILTIYLNRVYFGTGTYGVTAAAKRYFGVRPKRLTLHQSAILAGLLKAPSRLNPASDPKAALERAQVVLGNMVEAGYITKAEAAAASRTPPRFARGRQVSRVGRYFSDWVLDQLPSFVGPITSDITIRTTLDIGLQQSAEAAVEQVLADAGTVAGVGQAALIALAPDGAVRAMVGGRDFAESQFNRVTQARRQPGSAFKPVVYLAGLEAGFTPESRLIDEPISIDGWQPRNYGGDYAGPVTMREGLARSINTVAVKIAENAGRGRVVETARRLGITAPLNPRPSLALGAAEVSLLELTAAYGSFANGGLGVWTYAISDIRDGHGRILYRRTGDGPGRVIAPEHVADMNDMLAAALNDGTGKRARFGRPAAGKTGTSQEFRDALFVGYTADLVVGVWLGNDNGAAMNGITGGGLPALLWRRFMSEAHRGLPLRPLPGVRGLALGPTEAPSPGFWRHLAETLSSDGSSEIQTR